MPGVAFAADYRYMCSSPGQEIVREVQAAIAANPVVVVGMRMNPHPKQARRALDAAGVNGPLTSPGHWPQVFVPLAAAIHAHHLPVRLLHDLLDAFVQDCGNPRYTDRTQLLDYCRRSANPVGTGTS